MDPQLVVLSQRNPSSVLSGSLLGANGEYVCGLEDVSFTEGEYVEILCETRHFGTELRWFLNEKEIVNGDRFTTKRVGFTKRLQIQPANKDDVGMVRVVASAVSCSALLTGRELYLKLA